MKNGQKEIVRHECKLLEWLYKKCVFIHRLMFIYSFPRFLNCPGVYPVNFLNVVEKCCEE